MEGEIQWYHRKVDVRICIWKLGLTCRKRKRKNSFAELEPRFAITKQLNTSSLTPANEVDKRSEKYTLTSPPRKDPSKKGKGHLDYSPDHRCHWLRLQFSDAATVVPAICRISCSGCPNVGCNTVWRPDRYPPAGDPGAVARTTDGPRPASPRSVGICYRRSNSRNSGSHGDIVVRLVGWLVNFG